jgi:hypothetical protein
MDWNKALVLVGQLAVLAVLGTLVCLGHNDQVQTGLMAVCGSIAGVGLYAATRKSTPPDPS